MSGVSRRHFLVRATLGGGAIWLGGGIAWPGRILAQDEETLVALKDRERAIFAAIADRILPPGETSGGLEAGCVGFAERALCAEERESSGTVLDGLTALRAAAHERYGRGFVELSAERQDELLALVESGEISAWAGPDPRRFFDVVRRLVILGFLADPRYGGNRQAAGWRAVGYPAPAHEESHSDTQLLGEQRVVPIWERPRRLPPGPV